MGTDPIEPGFREVADDSNIKYEKELERHKAT